MSELITSQVSKRICDHMNQDHAEAVVLYAQFFGSIDTAKAAQMLSIDQQGMDLHVETQEQTTSVRIEFEHLLEDAQDAHHTLIAMLKEARAKLKESPETSSAH
jgi:hypothetical protein